MLLNQFGKLESVEKIARVLSVYGRGSMAIMEHLSLKLGFLKDCHPSHSIFCDRVYLPFTFHFHQNPPKTIVFYKQLHSIP